MPEVSRTVTINAPPERVWKTMIDVERWPDYMPHFRSVEWLSEGSMTPGARAKVTPVGFYGTAWEATEVTPPASFTWGTDVMPGILLVAGHVIEPVSEGARLTLTLRSSGALAALLSPIVSWTFRRNLRLESEALKQRCET
jgi:uncharacterized protein YndB with AHSA1/START domain